MDRTVGEQSEAAKINNPIDIDTSLPFRIIQLANLFGTNYDRQVVQTGTRLSVAEWRVMMTLGWRTGIHAIDVCRHTGYSEVNVSRALSRMSDRGWVRREADPDDRRKYRLYLTPAGVDIYNRLEPNARASIADLKSQIPPEVEKQVHAYLDKFIKTMQDIVSRK